MSRFPLALTESNRQLLKDIKYLTDKSFNQVINEILAKYLPVYLKEIKETK